MKKTFIALAFILLVMPLVYADLIEPGTHSIPVNNQITNMNDFPDYVFISGGPIMCNFIKVADDGIIENCYKLSSLNVYAIPKENFSEDLLINLNNKTLGEAPSYSMENITNTIYSLGGKKVLENIEHYKTVSDSSSIKGINNTYIIDLNQVKTNPDNIKNTVDHTRENLIYIYVIIPIIALIILFIILIRRQRKNAAS